MTEQDRIKNSPRLKARMALNTLNADLTYDNRNKAKKLIESLVEELEHQERKGIQERLEDQEEMKQEGKMFLVSTCLTDEFWQNIVEPAPKTDRIPVPQKEKQRYESFFRPQGLRVSEYLAEIKESISHLLV